MLEFVVNIFLNIKEMLNIYLKNFKKGWDVGCKEKSRWNFIANRIFRNYIINFERK